MESLLGLRPIYWIITANLIILTLKAYQRLCRSSLASVPGPLSGKLTGTWILLHGLCTNRSHLTRQLHRQYGSVVQLSPHELSFNTATAIHAIYGAATISRKPQSYSKFGRTGMFHLQDPEQHRERRKRMGDTYSMKAAIRSEPLIERRIQMLLKVIDDKRGQAIDTLHWNRMMIVDMASGVFWGKPFGAMEGETPPELMACLNGSFLSWSLRYYSPWLHKILTSIPIQKLQYLLNIDEFLYKSGSDAVAAQVRNHGRNSEQETVLARLIRGDTEKGLPPLPDNDIAIEAANAIFAATETTSSTLAYAQYELARHPEWQQHLRDEITEAKTKTGVLDFQAINGLPLLNGVIQETLRLHPACAYAPRLIPAPGCTIDGIDVPEGTIVSVSATVSQFNPEVFPNPETYDPSRWIQSDQNMRDMMMAWTKGVRVCAGQNLAIMEMKLSIARMVERYTMRVASEKTVEDMKGVNIEEVMLPKGRKCMLIFEKV